MTSNKKELSEEFHEFLSADEVRPSPALSDAILIRVRQDLSPSGQKVFLKMLAVHTLVSVFSLSVCSQFGIRSFKIYDAMESMMAVAGEAYCMALCGLLYLSISGLALSFLLSPEELKVIRRQKFLQLTLLTGVSLGVFLCLGAEVLLVPGALWVAGSLIGGVTTLELGWLLRSKFRNQLIFGT